MMVVLGACTFPPLERATPSPSPPPTTSATASESASPVITAPPGAEASPPTPTPDFQAGEIVGAAIDGLRVRILPGVERPIVTGLLPLAFELRVVLGPVPVDQLGWYLVTDADPRAPDFDEGWVAAGTEADPLLLSTGRADASSPFIISMDQTGDAEHGPIEIGDGDHAVRWVAVDPERVRCSFGVSFTPAGATEPVPAIRATIGSGIDRGTLQPQSFAALNLEGPLFVSVVSDCAWALVVLRVADEPSPTPTPS